MKRIFTKLRFSVLLLTFLFAFSNAFAQDEIEQKRAEAQKFYDEAINLRNENTFDSYKLAFAKFQAAAKIFAEIDDQGKLGRAFLGSGLVKDLMSENDAALEFYEKALAIFRTIGDKKIEATALSNLGKLYYDIGENRKALEIQNQALILRKETGDRSGEALTIDFLGLIYGALGEKQKALEFFNQSLAIHKELDEFSAQANTLSNIGLLFTELGEDEKAVEYFKQSLALRKITDDKKGEAVTLNNLGLALDNLGETAKAIENYEKAVEIFNSLGFENRTAAIVNNLSVSYLNIGNFQKSLEFARRALALYQKNGEKSGTATALNNIANALINLNDPKQAATELNQALLIAKEIGDKSLESTILSNLMQIYKKLDAPEAAIFFGKQAINNYQELRRNIKDLEQTTQKNYLKTVEYKYRFLADLLIENGKFAQAEQVLQMLKQEEYFDFVKRDAKEIKTLNQRVILNDRENEILKRYTLLADKLTEIGEEFQKLDNKKRQLSRTNETLSAEEQKKYDEISAQIADANAAFKFYLEKELTKELGAETAKKIEIDRNLQSKLRKWGDGTVAVYTVVTENRYRVVLTTPTIQIDGKTEIKSAVLNKKIYDFRNALQDPKTDPRPLGKELYDILVKPIEKELQAANAKTLVWSLDGSLRYIPLAALSPDGTNYLVEKYQNAVITPKTRDDLSDSNADWKALGLGVSEAQKVSYPDSPDEKVDVAALPFTKEEINTIIRDETNPNENGVLEGRKFFDKDFTLKNFTDSLAKETADGNRKFTVVHLASHFRLGNNWANSFLLLGNAKVLTLEELSSSPEIDFGNVELVTLSACNTAFGADANGKEIDSLAEAIQTKSAKAVLASLWEVSDESTASLMSNFYKLRKENPKLTKAEAIQNAQKLLIEGNSKSPKPAPTNSADKTKPPRFTTEKDRPFAHPFFWSGFVLIGNWR
ncbi:MAG TPA: CHAT domain-containing protein [Pyrinomonadaceae bacterium]|nr:CHAT domain-containing protein [Pyrinomonadaceae bacterium]